MSRVLVNLIGNAIKFTPHGIVELRVRCKSIDCDCCTLQFDIADNGAGIPADKLERIFDPFEQADTSLSREESGTGLGLAIASKIVELMEGSIGVESRVGEGSTFYFDATFRSPVVGTSGSETSDVRRDEPRCLDPQKPLRILVADDVEPNRLTLQHMLEEGGHSVVVVASGQEALCHLQQSTFDVVLMDIQMPGMDGFETTRRIRELNAGQGLYVPVIALTAHAMKGSKDWCLNNGMDGYATKPMDWHDLYEEIQRVTNSQWTHREPMFSMPDFVKRTGVDEVSANRLVSRFLSVLPSLVDGVLASTRLQDRSGLEDSIHRLKGALVNVVGADNCSEIIMLENSVSSGDELLSNLVF